MFDTFPVRTILLSVNQSYFGISSSISITLQNAQNDIVNWKYA